MSHLASADDLPTVLIVDDTPINLGVIVESLEEHGFRVLVAQDGEEGLQRAVLVQPDLILLDVMMPGPDGFEICRRLKQEASTQHIPVIFMTSLTETEDKIAGFRVGGIDYVTKPLQIDEVTARVSTHLQLHRMRLQLETQNRELQRYQETLEQQVAERTAELRASYQQLRENEQQYRTLAENSPDSIVRYDRDCRRIFANPAYYHETGLTPGSAQHKTPSELWRPTNISADEYQAILREVMDTGGNTEVLVEFQTADGKLSSIILRIVAERDAQGEVVGALVLGHNISAIKRHERIEEVRLHIFEGLAQGAALKEVLDLVCSFVEKSHPEFLSSIMLVSADEQHLISTSAPRLPAFYTAAINGNRIGEGSGSCGTAVARGEAFMVEDVRTHPYWASYKQLTQQAELLSCWSIPIKDSAGKTLGAFGIYRRETGLPNEDDMELVRGASHLAAIAIERRRAEETLWESEQKYRTLVENSPDLFVRYDLDCRRTYISDSNLLMDSTLAQALGKKPTELWGTPGMSPEDFESRLREVMRTGRSIDIELDWEHNAIDCCYQMRVVPEFDRDGKIVSVLSISHDVSDIKRAEKALHRKEQEIRSLVENSPDTIVRFDRDCRRLYANPRMLVDLGVSLEQLLGCTPMEFPGGDSARFYEDRIRKALAGGQADDFELIWHAGDGRQIVSHIRLTPEFDAQGNVTSALAVGRDISEIDAYRQRINRLAFFDTLTDLPNRALLADRISQTIHEADWHGTEFGLLMLDLDRFKEVNDTLGHGVGDQLLRGVADRLLVCVRSYDTVARLGGDEFAILLPELREANDLANIARKIIKAFEQPFNISGKELFISASIGIALYPDDSAEIEALFRFADSAMYHAKKQGRNNFQFYSRELTARSAERLTLESALRRARRNHELELYYQPQIDISTGAIIGAEALLRWQQNGAMVTPDKFIPIAEETGLIVNIGEWAMHTAFEAAVAWNQDRDVPFKVAVNLSTRQFVQNDIVATLRTVLMQTNCRAEWIKLEITESLLLDDSTHVLETLNTLSHMGFTISIDDFGTGYSALSYLNRFPVDQIKIDRAFVRNVPYQQDKSELVKAIISIAEALQLELVAEGVETREQSDYLLTHGCHIVQGFLYGKPMPLAEFETHMLKSGAMAQRGLT